MSIFVHVEEKEGGPRLKSNTEGYTEFGKASRSNAINRRYGLARNTNRCKYARSGKCIPFSLNSFEGTYELDERGVRWSKKRSPYGVYEYRGYVPTTAFPEQFRTAEMTQLSRALSNRRVAIPSWVNAGEVGHSRILRAGSVFSGRQHEKYFHIAAAARFVGKSLTFVIVVTAVGPRLSDVSIFRASPSPAPPHPFQPVSYSSLSGTGETGGESRIRRAHFSEKRTREVERREESNATTTARCSQEKARARSPSEFLERRVAMSYRWLLHGSSYSFYDFFRCRFLSSLISLCSSRSVYPCSRFHDKRVGISPVCLSDDEIVFRVNF